MVLIIYYFSHFRWKFPSFYAFLHPLQKSLMRNLHSPRSFPSGNIPFFPLNIALMKVLWLFHWLGPKPHTSSFGRCDPLGLPLPDKLAFFLRHIGQQLQNNIRNQCTG